MNGSTPKKKYADIICECPKYKLREMESINGCMHPKDSYGAPHGNVIHEDSYGPPHAEPIHKGGPILRLSLHEKTIYDSVYFKHMNCLNHA